MIPSEKQQGLLGFNKRRKGTVEDERTRLLNDARARLLASRLIIGAGSQYASRHRCKHRLWEIGADALGEVYPTATPAAAHLRGPLHDRLSSSWHPISSVHAEVHENGQL